jgi:hypothetical protein
LGADNSNTIFDLYKGWEKMTIILVIIGFDIGFIAGAAWKRLGRDSE